MSGSAALGGSIAFQKIAISPDGQTLAVAVVPPETEKHGERHHKIVLIPLKAGPTAAVRFVDPDPRISGRANNGNTLLYAITENGVANLWVQPLSGRPGHQITSFPSEQINSIGTAPQR